MGGRDKKTTDDIKLVELAHALSVNVEWLATGKGQMEAITLSLSNPTCLATADSIAITQEQSPPVVEQAFWNALSPRTRALVEEITHMAGQGQLTDDDIKFIQDMIDKVSKK